MRHGLYAIIDLAALGPRDPIAFADRVLDAGDLFALQLRAKHAPSDEILRIATALAHRARRRRVPFYVNDRADLALLAGADGVHGGQDDLPPDALARIVTGFAFGVSTHSLSQLEAALREGPAYVAIGPVFDTTSKERPDAPVGLEGIVAAAAHAGAVPLVAIGGITLARASAVCAAGATAGAVIGALAAVHDDEVTDRARAFHLALGGMA